MSNSYYTFTPRFIPGTKVRAQAVNTQFDLIEDAFDNLPAIPSSLPLGTSTLGVESGSGNAYVVTMPNTRVANANGDEVVFKATHQNSGASTLQVDSIAAVSLVRFNGDPLSSGDILSGTYYTVRYDSTNIRFMIVSPAQSTVVGTISYADPSASVGLTAVNGVATTVMRSDSAPALSQSIVPTWSGQHTFSQPILAASGLVGTPGYAFSGDADTGMYHSGADEVDFAAGGVLQLALVASSRAQFFFPVWTAAGSAANPAFSFTGDSNTGSYNVSADTWGVSCGGTLRFSVNGSGNGVFTGTVSGTNLSSSGGANPSASVGLAAVNGSAITFMRSDGAPALSQSVAPTWTGTHTFTNTTAQAVFNNSGAALNAKNTIERINASGTFAISSASDAAPTTAVTNIIAGTRSGSAWTDLTFGNGTDNPTFNFNGTGAVTASGVFRAPDGAVGAPAFSFSGDTDTGIYRVTTNQMGLTAGGNLIANVYSGGVNFTNTVGNQIGMPDGTALLPGINFTSDGDTGIYHSGANEISFSAGGALQVAVVGSSRTQFLFPVWAADGSVGAPSISFSADSDTGFYRQTTNEMRAVTGGVGRMIWSDTAVFGRVPFCAADGSSGAPGYSFENDTDTGIWRSGANALDFATGGVNRVEISTTAVTSTLPFFGPNGSASTPAFAFSNENDCGMYLAATGASASVAIAVNTQVGLTLTDNGAGTAVAAVIGNGVPTHRINTATTTTANTGASGALPAQVVGYWQVNINGTTRLIPFYST